MDSPAQRVKERLNIVEVIGGYVQLQKAGRNFRARCPFHKERTPSFMVSPERGTYMCFGCGEKGDIFSFVEKIENIDFKTALVQLAERAGVELPKFPARAPEHQKKDDRLREACEEAARFFESQLIAREDVAKHVASRGVADATRAQWRIGYAPASWEELSKHLVQKGFSKQDIVDAGLAAKSEKKAGEIYDRFRGRIMFPIFDTVGRPVAFSGRFFEKVSGSREEGEPAKYVNSPETDLFKKSRILYGLNFAKDYIRKADCALLVEGQFDVVLSHQSGLRFAVAISGTALTPEHLSLLGRYSKRLVLALDADTAGIRSGLKSAEMALRAGFDVKIPKIQGGKDPADLASKDPELLKSAVRGSLPAIEFFLDVLRSSAKDERGYKKLVEAQILPLIAAIPSKIDQAHFITVVARHLRVPEAAVAAEVAKRPILSDSDAPVVSESAGRPEDSGNADVSSLERGVGMLLFCFAQKTAVRERLEGLLSGPRLMELQEKLTPQAERLRFEFEALGEDAVVCADMLLETIERGAVEEELVRAREALGEAERNGDAPGAAVQAGKLSALARRKEELRH